MPEKIALNQLKSFLWETADILRGNMNDKKCILGILFMKRLSDAFGEAKEQIVASY